MSRTMNSRPAPKAVNMMKLKNSLSTKVESFFQRMTGEQWELLKACNPDATTRLKLSELLMDIVLMLSKVFLTTVWRNVSKEDIQASLGHMVTDTFKSALDIKDEVQCESADRLLELINGEVADRVNSALSNPEESGVALHTTPPNRLHTMVVHAVTMMKNFLARVKKIFTCRSTKITSDQTKEELVVEEVEDIFELFQRKSMERAPSKTMVGGLTSVSPLKETVNLDVDQEVQEPEDTADKTEESEHTLKEKKERSVELIIEKLFSRIFRECRLDMTFDEPKVTLLRLFERTWAKVEGIDFDLSAKNLKNLDGVIFKDLCKKLGSVHPVVLSMRVDDDMLVNYIVSSFHRHVAPQPKKMQRVAGFFSSVGRAVANTCKRRNRVGVL